MRVRLTKELKELLTKHLFLLSGERVIINGDIAIDNAYFVCHSFKRLIDFTNVISFSIKPCDLINLFRGYDSL